MNKIPEERRTAIIDALKKHGYLSVVDLAGMLFVSVPTIRRDLTALEKDGALLRTHGGASFLNDASVTEPFSMRYRENMNEKRIIGRLAAKLIQNGDTVFMDASSTTHALAKSIKPELNLRVLTNAVSIAKELGEYEHVFVELPGGNYDHKHEAVFGEETVEYIRKRNADWFFFSGNGLDPQKGVTSNFDQDGAIKRAMREHSKKTVLLMDHFKENKVYFYHLFDWRDIDIKPSDAMRDSLGNAGVELIVPPPVKGRISMINRLA